jgi:hypothetical protein
MWGIAWVIWLGAAGSIEAKRGEAATRGLPVRILGSELATGGLLVSNPKKQCICMCVYSMYVCLQYVCVSFRGVVLKVD